MVRMLGGFQDNFFMKIGNALCGRHHHFYKSCNSDRYVNILLDETIGVREGRQPPEFFDEMKKEMNDQILYNSFYKCEFPPEDSPTGGVWVPLLTDGDLEKAMDWDETEHFGEMKLGVDVADSGIDHDTMVKRSSGLAEIVYDSQDSDQMRLAGLVVAQNIRKTYVDRRGVGAGVSSRLRQLEFPHIQVDFGASPLNRIMFANRKAELFWAARQWILNGGKLSKDRRWKQLTSVLYTIGEGNGKITIMPKKMSINMGIKSPDIADAFVCTFFDKDTFKSKEENLEREFRKKMKRKRIKKGDRYHIKMA
jgi:hypothetical protein